MKLVCQSITKICSNMNKNKSKLNLMNLKAKRMKKYKKKECY